RILLVRRSRRQRHDTEPRAGTHRRRVRARPRAARGPRRAALRKRLMPSSETRTRYAGAAQHYDRSRPSYPAALIDWIIAGTHAPPARVADIGCGTGIATRLFAARGFDVVGVDPSEEMLAFAHRAGMARYVCAHAAATSLASGSIDLVVAAQCFHW